MTRAGSTKRKLGAIAADVRALAERLADERDLVLWDIEFGREAGREVLRISLDRVGGIDSGTISRFAQTLSRLLDEEDLVPGEGRYILEVTSPGADRRLRTPEQFAVCRDRDVRVTFTDGREPIEGTIGDVEGDAVHVETDDQGSVRVRIDEISQARLTVPGV